jgi:hypothetical protein
VLVFDERGSDLAADRVSRGLLHFVEKQHCPPALPLVVLSRSVG